MEWIYVLWIDVQICPDWRRTTRSSHSIASIQQETYPDFEKVIQYFELGTSLNHRCDIQGPKSSTRRHSHWGTGTLSRGEFFFLGFCGTKWVSLTLDICRSLLAFSWHFSILGWKRDQFGWNLMIHVTTLRRLRWRTMRLPRSRVQGPRFSSSGTWSDWMPGEMPEASHRRMH